MSCHVMLCHLMSCRGVMRSRTILGRLRRPPPFHLGSLHQCCHKSVWCGAGVPIHAAFRLLLFFVQAATQQPTASLLNFSTPPPAFSLLVRACLLACLLLAYLLASRAPTPRLGLASGLWYINPSLETSISASINDNSPSRGWTARLATQDTAIVGIGTNPPTNFLTPIHSTPLPLVQWWP